MPDYLASHAQNSDPRHTATSRTRRSWWLKGSLAVTAAGALAAGGLYATTAVAGPGGTDPIVVDSFNRTVNGGWGSADTGGTWLTGVTPSPSQLAVTPGAGTLTTAPSQGAEVLSSTSAADTDQKISFSVSALPAAGSAGVYVSLESRVQSDGLTKYLPRLRILPDGTVLLSVIRQTGTTQTLVGREVAVAGKAAPGQSWTIESRLSGTGPVAVSLRAYPTGTTAPNWQDVTSDTTPGALSAAGHDGVFTYLSSKATAPVTVSVSSLEFDNLASSSGSGGPGARPGPGPGSGNPPGGTAPRAALTAGSVPVGSAAYTLPSSGAVYVSPTGSDAGAGTLAAPFKTLAHAISASPTGGTIVLRAGEYNEDDSIPSNKSLTVENYPHEAAYLDGATHVNSGWTQTGSTWTLPGWTAQFDNSASDSPNTPTGAGWSFVGPQNPLANHADGVWIDGVQQTLVGSASDVVPGTFYVDYSNHELVIGSDPAGHDVKASNLVNGLIVYGANSTIRGIGVRDYADSLDKYGALVISNASGVTLENDVVNQNATYGIEFSSSPKGVVHNVTADANGLLGMGAYESDNLTIRASQFDTNNTHNFNQSPKSGGFKSDDTRGVTVTNSQFDSNTGPGMWFDQSTYNVTANGNDMIGNAGHGVSFEISAKLMFVNNRVVNNGGDGLKLNDSNGITLQNNTITGSGKYDVWAVQDSRVASDESVPGHDRRQPQPDPTMTWILGSITANNNVFGDTKANVVFDVQDNAQHRTAAQMGITLDSNVYARPSTSSPSWLVAWPAGGSNPATYTTVAALRAGTGEEAHGTGVDVESIDTSSLRTDGQLSDQAQANADKSAQPMPANAKASTESTDSQTPDGTHVGAWI